MRLPAQLKMVALDMAQENNPQLMQKLMRSYFSKICTFLFVGKIA